MKRSVEEWKEFVESDFTAFSAPPNGSVFWSGKKNRCRAESFANHQAKLGNFAVTLERTSGGQQIDHAGADGEGLFKDPEIEKSDAREIWARAGARFAREARGEVHSFSAGSHEQSVFRSVEMPLLLENERVTAINGIPRERLRMIARRDAREAHRMLVAAEIARDRQRGREQHDLGLLEDVEERQRVAETSEREVDRIRER